jgi:hypothetical protein
MRTIGLGFAALLLVAACDGGDGGTDAGSDDDDGGGGGLTCATYCTTIMANCTGDLTQYASTAACMQSCEGFPIGTSADTAGNTLGCRIYHAQASAAAMLGPDPHCYHAGPGGAGVCGSNCEGFCAIAQDSCTGGNQQYASAGDCMTECGNFPDTEPYDASDQAGDSLACRLYHLTVASTDMASATTHCPHIPEASPVCVP